MAYSVGQKVVYKALNGTKEDATVIARKIDFKNGVIEIWNAQGNFDYLVTVEKNGIIEQHFCEEEDIE
ncbi:hypothetical protein [Flavobacterium sp. UBA7663]|uniref:hypothetical protein n=1 Tax=Flavobacterium sp. UBA7663 TaxID=1946557 RepID=UPI0025BEA203|nr:hypothetical protein [Flavobacterium sp. UBA7663]